MKHLTSFRASRVFTHLEMDIVFFPELTFLYGLNGSGKTTALRLIMGLLQPSIETLGRIDFRSATISGESHTHGAITISAEKTETHLILSCSVCEEPCTIPLELFEVEESEQMLARECSRSKVFEVIRDISSPMFLGIDRRFVTPDARQRHQRIASSRDMASRFRRERMAAQEHSYDRGLAEVADLIDTYVAKLHAVQERVTDQFRKDLLLESFSYVDPSIRGFSFEPPSEEEFSDFQRKRKAISKALAVLDLTSDEFEEKSEKFFSAIEDIITTIRQGSPQRGKAKNMDKKLSECG